MVSDEPTPAKESQPTQGSAANDVADATPIMMQFSTRDMLTITGLLSLMIALLAPLFRHLPAEAQWNVAKQVLFLSLFVGGILVFTVMKRRKVEALLGAPVRRFSKRSSRWFNYALGCLLLLTLMLSIGLSALSDPTGQRASIVYAPQWFWFVYAMGTFWVRRVVFQIDKSALEVCPRGLLYGGFESIPWDSITRYSWSSPSLNDSSCRQLNLFLTKRIVVDLPVPSEWVYDLDNILRSNLP